MSICILANKQDKGKDSKEFQTLLPDSDFYVFANPKRAYTQNILLMEFKREPDKRSNGDFEPCLIC